MIKAFLFDIGKVLLNFDYQQAVDHVRAKSPLSSEQIRTAIGQFHIPLETGSITTGSFLEQAVQATQYGGAAEEFAAGYCDIFTLNQPMWELVDALRKNFPLYLFFQHQRPALGFHSGKISSVRRVYRWRFEHARQGHEA